MVGVVGVGGGVPDVIRDAEQEATVLEVVVNPLHLLSPLLTPPALRAGKRALWVEKAAAMSVATVTATYHIITFIIVVVVVVVAILVLV